MLRPLEISLTLDVLGLLATLPCLFETTPITMTLFFFLAIPLFTAGLLEYLWLVIADLRHHRVL